MTYSEAISNTFKSGFQPETRSDYGIILPIAYPTIIMYTLMQIGDTFITNKPKAMDLISILDSGKYEYIIISGRELNQYSDELVEIQYQVVDSIDLMISSEDMLIEKIKNAKSPTIDIIHKSHSLRYVDESLYSMISPWMST